MDSLERAKRFLAGKGSKLAMAAVPLAALAVAVPAKAGAILSPVQCDATAQSGGYCSIVQAGAQGGNIQANWLQLYGQGSAVYSGSGSYYLDFSPSGGIGSGSLSSGTIPVSWDLDVFSSGSQVNYTIYYEVSVNGNPYTASQSGSTVGSSGGTVVVGTSSITLPSGGGTVSGYNYDVYFTSNSPFSVTIPSGSTADLNPASAVPEPATLLMTAAGGAFLLMGKKKRA